MYSDITIRFTTPKDAEEIYNVMFNTWLATYPNEELNITKESIEQFYSNRAERIERYRTNAQNNPGEDFISFVAEINNKIVGTGLIQKTKNSIKSIYILPEFQGLGIGRKIMEEFFNYLDSNSPVYVNVASYNSKAIKFYEKLGFKFLREKAEDIFTMPNGAKIPEIEMIKT